jgi:hypothetical protein
MKKIVFVMILFPFQNLLSQHLKIDAGAVFSEYTNEFGRLAINKQTVTPSINLGIDYLEHKWFYVSSQLGYLQIRGMEISDIPEETARKERKNYVYISTLFRPFARRGDLTGFIGIGPYGNIRLGDKMSNNSNYQQQDLKSYFGAKFEMGLHLDRNQFRYGINASSMHGLTPAIKASSGSLTSENVGFYASVGYKLQFKRQY